MSVVDRLASSRDRNDEAPNIELAEELARTGDISAIAELVTLTHAGTKPIRHDAIKAAYELGERRPDLLAPHLEILLTHLSSKDNRMLWGVMSALAAIAPVAPHQLVSHLEKILDAADRGSVIAKDKLMVLLSVLAAQPALHDLAMPILLQRLTHAAVNQVPMYAELTASALQPDDLDRFQRIVSDWRDAIPYPAKKKRLDKLLKRTRT